MSGVPEGWNSHKLRDVVKIEYGKGLSPEERNGGDFPIYGTSGITGYTTKSLGKSPSILIGRKGTIDKPIFIDKDFWIIDTAYFVKSEQDMKYLYYKLSSINLTKYNESTGVPSLNREALYNIPIPLPPLPEQKQISTILSRVDEKIESIDKKIEKSKLLKQGLLKKLLSEGIGHTEFKDTEIGRIPKEWEVVSFGDVLEYEQPQKYLENEYDDNYSDEKLPVLTANKSFLLGYTDNKQNSYKNLPVIIFDDFTTLNKYVNFEFKIKSSAIKLLKVKNDDSDLKYLFERMAIVKFEPQEHKRRWISEYQHIRIELPPLPEQKKISTILSRVDEKIENLQNEKSSYTQLKSYLLQKLLTGQIRVKIDEN
jgi:type I restriction enzyme, S subunit